MKLFNERVWFIFLTTFVIGLDSCHPGQRDTRRRDFGGWSSDDVEEDSTCTFDESQIQSLLQILQMNSQTLEGLTPKPSNPFPRSLEGKSSKNTVTLSKCDQYLYQFELSLRNVTYEALRLKNEGSQAVGLNERIKSLEDSNRKLQEEFLNLKREHEQEINKIKDEFDQQVQIYEEKIEKLKQEVRKTQELFYENKIKTIVLILRSEKEEIDDAVAEMKYFVENDRDYVETVVKEVVRKVYEYGKMKSWDRLMLFISKIPLWVEMIQGYQLLVELMHPLAEKDADVLLRFAYKIKLHGSPVHPVGLDLIELINSFPKTVKDLIWHNKCRIKNKQSGHFMKVISENQAGTTVYHMIGENGNSGAAWWRLSPYQPIFPNGTVTFRVENEGTKKFLKDFGAVEFDRTVGEAKATDAKWEVRFRNNRVGSHSGNSEAFLFAHFKRKYLYEARRNWETWRCGFNQWKDCAVICQEEHKIYDEGKWIFECE